MDLFGRYFSFLVTKIVPFPDEAYATLLHERMPVVDGAVLFTGQKNSFSRGEGRLDPL